MKNPLIAILLLAFTAIGCGKKDDKAAINNVQGREERGGGQVVQGAPEDTSGAFGSSAIELDGQIFHNDPNVFQKNVRGFVDATLPGDYLGYVGTGFDGRTDSGVFLGGKVSLVSGTLDPVNGTSRVAITANSRLLVVVWDEYVGKKDDKGQTLPAIPVYLTKASGIVEGKQAKLVFEDEFGTIELEGSFDRDFFDGNIHFDNRKKYDGSGLGSAGTLGGFRIPTCRLFNCR